MRLRLLFACSILFAGLTSVAVALGSSAYLTASSNHGPGHATPQTERFQNAAERAEDHGYVKRGTKGKIELKGWIEVTHADGASNGKVSRRDGFIYALHGPGGRIFVLNPPAAAAKSADPAFVPNEVVTVSGVETPTGVKVAEATVAGASLPKPGLEPTTDPRTPDSRNVLVLRLKFPGDSTTSDPLPIATARGEVFDNLRSAKNYYLATSDSDTTLTGDVSQQYVSLTIGRTPAADCAASRSAGLYRVQPNADQAAANAGIDVNAYDHVMYAFEDTPGCQGAWGNISGPHSWYSNFGYVSDSTVSHELGHNLGMHHSNERKCQVSGIPVPLTADPCETDEYNDPTDVMGGSGAQHLLTGFHRAQLGFIPLKNVKDVTPALGTPLTLTNTESRAATGTTQLLRIARPHAPLDPDNAQGGPAVRGFLYVDYRRPSGIFDNYATNEPLVNGVVVRAGAALTSHGVQPEVIYANGGGIDGRGVRRSYTPQPDSPMPLGYDAALAPGQSLWDPAENITITTVSTNATSAQVEVTPGPPPGNPTVVSVSGDKLTVAGGPSKRNHVILGRSGGEVIVVDTSATLAVTGTVCAKIDAITARCPETAIRSVQLDLGDGDDLAQVSPAKPFGLPVTFLGGAGSDVLEGGDGDDTFDGGLGADLIDGGAGFDTVTYASRTATIKAGLNGTPQFSAGEAGERDMFDAGVEKLVTGSGNDQIGTGSSAVNTFDPGPGADSVKGEYGGVTIYARDGVQDTSLTCGSGSTDRVYGDANDPASADCETKTFVPQVTITGGPAQGSSVNSTQPQFTFNAPFSSGVTYYCKNEAGTGTTAGAYTACTSPYTPPVQAQGVRTLTVRAVVGGASSGDPATRTYTVDTAAPETAVISGPPTVTKESTATFVLSSTDPGAGFECQLDSGPWYSCISTKSYSGITEGAHTFRARAIDAAGNVDATPATFTWNRSTVAPDTIIDSGPAEGASLAVNAVTFTFHATTPGTSTFVCQYGGGQPAPCTSPWTVNVLPGTPTFRITATSQGGVVDPTPATRTITLTQAFDTTITSGPSPDAYTNDSTPTFTFKSNPTTGYTFECSSSVLSTYTPCTSPFTMPAQADGVLAFRVRAVSTATGQYDATPGNWIFKIDTTPPDTRLDAGPAEGASFTASTASFSFSAPGEVSSPDCLSYEPSVCPTFECKLDAGSYTPCTSPWTTPALTAGAHSVSIRAVDQAGNPDPTPVTRTFTRTGGAPVLTIGAPVDLPDGTAVPLTSDATLGSALDWVHWKGALPTDVDRKSGAAQISTWAKKDGLGTPVIWAGTATNPLYSWTNAAGTASGSARSGVATGTNGRGFDITVPATTTQRKLKVWVAVRGSTATTTAALKVSLASGSPAASTVTVANASTTPVVKAYTVDFRSAQASDTLALQWYQGGGSSVNNTVLLYAAALY